MHFGVQARALGVDECVDDARIIHNFKYCRFGGFRYKRITLRSPGVGGYSHFMEGPRALPWGSIDFHSKSHIVK